MNGFTLPETTKGRTYKALILALHMLRETEGFNREDSRYLWMMDVFLDLQIFMTSLLKKHGMKEE